jgi:hypothetical protein
MHAAPLIALAALATVVEGDAPTPAAPALAVSGCRADEASASGTRLAFDIRLANPTGAPVRLGAVLFSLEVLGKSVVEGTLPLGADVAAGGSVTFPIVANLRWADLPSMAAKGALGRTSYRLVVSAAIQTPLGEIVVPLTHDGELSLPKRPGFGLSGLRVASLNPLDAAVEVRIEMAKDNDFPLPAGQLRFRLSIAGADVTSAEVALPTVAPAAKVVVPIPVAVSLRQAGRGVFTALKGDATSVGLHAVASIGDLALPVDLEAQLPTHL